MGPIALTLPLATVEATALATVRFSAFLVIAPPFAQRGVPGMVKALLALTLGLAVTPRLNPGGAPSTAAFVGDLVLQALIGAGLGFLVMVVFAAVQSAGDLVDLFGGFQLATAFDPMSLTSGAQFSRLYQMTAMVLLFVTGGYQMLLAGLVRSFDAVPLGSGISLAALADAATSGLSQMMVAALQIAGPLLVVLFLTDVGLGLLTRVAPALNAFALGFPLKILMTLVFGGFAYLAMPGVVGGLVDHAVRVMAGVAQ